MGINSFLWQAFLDTGDIKAYLLYKNAVKYEKNKGEEARWQASAPRVS